MKQSSKFFLSLIIIFCLVFSFSSVTFANESLKGLEGVRVLVADLDASSGLTKEAVKKDAILKLRAAGIKVFEDYEAEKPYLYISLKTIKAGKGFWVFHTKVQLGQKVILQRDSSILCWTSTWQIEQTAFVREKDKYQVKNIIKTQFDKFIFEYRKQNRE